LTEKKTVIVIDTSAFIAGFDPHSIDIEQYSVPNVRNELLESSMPWVRFNAAVESGKLKLVEPSPGSLARVTESSKSAGDVLYLSEVDLQVLALSLQLKESDYDVMIVTDDYSIQNVANKIGVRFVSLVNFGIRYQFQWILYCPACHRKYPSDTRLKTCQFDGTELRRKPLRKVPIEK
jgi:rRNA maturation endonuclease Nob1